MADFNFDNVYDVSVTGEIATVNALLGTGNLTATADTPLNIGDNVSFFGTTYSYQGLNADGSMLLEGDNSVFILLSDTNLDANNNVQITQNAYCLLAGTMVLTPEGERPVEDIRPGDEVLTNDGEIAPVRWVGRQSLISVFSAHALPIVIQAGALGDNTPCRDLHMSPDHAVLFDNYLVQAQALVNGSTITVMAEPPAQLDYYHLELDQQRVIIADGAPVESFVDNVSRAGFDNFDEWVELGLEPLPVADIDLPRVKSARQLPAHISEQLAERGAYISA